MTLLDALAAIAMALAGGAVWSGLRGGVAWGPAAVAGLVLGVWGFNDNAPLLLVGCIVVVAFGAVLPVQLLAAARRRASLGDFAAAVRYATWLHRLRRHPAALEWCDNWRAVAAFYDGRPSEAQGRLDALAARDDPPAAMLRDALLASIRDWERAAHSPALDLEVRARCELGDVDAAVEAAGRTWSGRTPGFWLWRVWGLMLAPFAFAGRVEDVERAVDLLRLGPRARQLWAATALGAAGEPERAHAALDRVTEPLTPGMRAAVHARREALPEPATLGESSQDVLQTASRELRAAHLLRPRAPWRSWASLLVLGAIIFGFATRVSALRGGFGLEPLVVGEPLRPLTLLTYGLLHYDWVHLLTNLVALAFVTPIVARGLGEAGTLLVFTGGVVGAGCAVWAFSGHGVVVGASGGAMAILAAAVVVAVAHPSTRGTGTAGSAWRAALGLAVVQFSFDVLVPQVSLSAHLGGLLSGALLAGAMLAIISRR